MDLFGIMKITKGSRIEIRNLGFVFRFKFSDKGKGLGLMFALHFSIQKTQAIHNWIIYTMKLN